MVALLLVACVASANEATTAADDPAWGDAKAGLQISLTAVDEARWGGSMPLHVRMRNIGGEATKLPAALRETEQAFGWLIVQQGAGRNAKQYFSARFTVGNDVKAWPDELSGGASIDVLRRDVAGVKLYRYQRGVGFLDAYKVGEPADAKPLGPVTKALALGPTAIMVCLYVEAGERPTLLKSNLATVEVIPPELDKLSAARREAFLAELLAQFDRDAWSARAAHHAAVRLGPSVLPVLIETVNDRKRPAFSRMWLATSIADIRDPRAVAALTKLLQDTHGSVRTVAAYHGPKQGSDELNAAIVARAKELDAPHFTAYALLGFVAFGKAAPPELLEMGLDSDEPRVRTTAIRTMNKLAGDAPVARLTKLLEDPDARVRGQAARMLACFGKNMPLATLGALVEALALDGDVARMRICDALGALTGRRRSYDPKTSDEEKQRTIEYWRTWWTQASRK
jgi:HEAT repeat protein